MYSFLDRRRPSVSFNFYFLAGLPFLFDLFMRCYRKREVNLKVLKVPEIEQKV